MAEIVGLVVGGFPIAIWALEKYAEPWETYHRYHTTIQAFRADLILQKRQLQTSLLNIGLHDNPTTEEVREFFEEKFPDISPELMSIIRRMDETTASLLKSLEIDVNGKPDVLLGKVHWEWRRVKNSLSTKKRAKVVDDLRHWNDDLRRSLEKPEVPAQDDSCKVQDLKRRFNITRSNAIRQCLASLHRALELGFRCSCPTPHAAAIDLDWASYESDSGITFKVAVSYETSAQSQGVGSWCKLDITSETATETVESVPELPSIRFPAPVRAPALLVPSLPTGYRSPSPSSSFRSKVAHFKHSRTFSRTPPPPPTPPSTTASLPNLRTLDTAPAVPSPQRSGIASLCAALRTETCPWPLKRFLKDPDSEQARHYSLYHHPVDSPNIIKAVPVKSLLSSRGQQTQKRSPYLALTAKQRFGIAATIAWSVLHLSCSPWLDEREWDQKQMAIFIENTPNGRKTFSRHPCASYIFARRTYQEDVPPDFDNPVNSLVPNRTIFALGVLLIELCVSEPVSKPDGDNAGATSLIDDYQSALSRLDEVYRLAGDSYGYATERCVKCSFEGRDMYKDFEFSRFRQQFYDVVVAPVQATYLTFPESSHCV
ncbi:uncharacterized protein B0H64DRAFT_211728 [Chaetomium fimeti]|uniref:DUF7580 domain-containing protein n=1 Tax=Chaetomium fimeti TaxID=1854472 RepID=A0AAE0LQC6_9PEZI|nr:hypothetical protein B0H64DRAFT_211728 [Chaetomium fimeti]